MDIHDPRFYTELAAAYVRGRLGVRPESAAFRDLLLEAGADRVDLLHVPNHRIAVARLP